MAPLLPPESGNHQDSSGALPLDVGRYCIAFIVLAICTLFVPTIEMFKGSMSLGRVPVWLAYLGVFDPWYARIAIPIVVAHLSLTSVLAWVFELAVRRLWRRGDAMKQR